MTKYLSTPLLDAARERQRAFQEHIDVLPPLRLWDQANVDYNSEWFTRGFAAGQAQSHDQSAPIIIPQVAEVLNDVQWASYAEGVLMGVE